jgi:hypothetical protein
MLPPLHFPFIESLLQCFVLSPLILLQKDVVTPFYLNVFFLRLTPAAVTMPVGGKTKRPHYS